MARISNPFTVSWSIQPTPSATEPSKYTIHTPDGAFTAIGMPDDKVDITYAYTLDVSWPFGIRKAMIPKRRYCHGQLKELGKLLEFIWQTRRRADVSELVIVSVKVTPFKE